MGLSSFKVHFFSLTISEFRSCACGDVVYVWGAKGRDSIRWLE